MIILLHKNKSKKEWKRWNAWIHLLCFMTLGLKLSSGNNILLPQFKELMLNVSKLNFQFTYFLLLRRKGIWHMLIIGFFLFFISTKTPHAICIKEYLLWWKMDGEAGAGIFSVDQLYFDTIWGHGKHNEIQG